MYNRTLNIGSERNAEIEAQLTNTNDVDNITSHFHQKKSLSLLLVTVCQSCLMDMKPETKNTFNDQVWSTLESCMSYG